MADDFSEKVLQALRDYMVSEEMHQRMSDRARVIAAGVKADAMKHVRTGNTVAQSTAGVITDGTSTGVEVKTSWYSVFNWNRRGERHLVKPLIKGVMTPIGRIMKVSRPSILGKGISIWDSLSDGDDE